MRLFHGTLGKKRRRFVPFSHFGTYKAAVERIARRLMDGDRGSPLVLTVSFRFRPDQVLQLSEDWGSNQPIALARALKDHFESSDTQKYEVFEGIWRELIQTKGRNEAFEAKGWAQLGCTLNQMGVRALAYPNGVEALGSLSYCVVNETRRICIKACVPSDQELEQGRLDVKRVLPDAF